MILKKIAKSFMFLMLVAVILATTSLTPTSAYTLSGYKWSSPVVNYTIDSYFPGNNNVGASYSDSVNQTRYWWNSKTEVYLYSSSSSAAEVRAYDYGYQSWDGQTSTTYNSSTKTIINSIVRMNRYYTDNYEQLHMNLVMAHEFGHLIGLGHSYFYSMMYYADVWNSYQHNSDLQYGPVNDDITGVNLIY